MSTFNYFQIGDFCQRTFAGLLNWPAQARNTGLLDQLLDSPVSKAYQDIVQNGQGSRKYVLSYNPKECSEPSAVDICNTPGTGFTPTNRQIEYSFADAPTIQTRLMRVGSQSYRDWCDLNGGGAGYIQSLQRQFVNEFQQGYERLEKAILQAAWNNKGCYADGTATEKTIQLFLNPNTGVPTVNPAWSFGVEGDLAQLGLDTMAYYVGGKQFWQAQRIIQSQYQVPNTMLGVNPAASGIGNMAYSPMMSEITVNNTYEKVLVISPEAVALTTFSKVLNVFANTAITDVGGAIQQLFNVSFSNTASTQNMAFVLVDPLKGLLWDAYATLTQCGADFTLDFYAELTYRFHVLPMNDRICNNNCFAGIQVYNLCPLPTPEACDAPDAPVTPTVLCLDATLPDPCTYVVAAGETVTFTRGSFSLTWVAPITYTITSQNDLFVLLVSMFGSKATYGNWYINSCGDIAYNGLGADASGDTLAAGAGTITTTCFENPIAITIAECEAC